MPLKSDKQEIEILNFIFREKSSLEVNEKEICVNTYYAIKHHLPGEIFKSGKLKFSYNKGLTYILASYDDILLFKIPNNGQKVEIICPPSSEYIKNLDIPDTQKDNIIKKYRESKAPHWYISIAHEAVLSFSSSHWDEFTKTLKKISTK